LIAENTVDAFGVDCPGQFHMPITS